MNSELIPQNYANSNNILYGAHIVTLSSDKVTYDKNVGKFVMSYVTPNSSGEAYDRLLPKNATRNVVNKDKLDVTKITSSNYISITIPKYLFYITDIDITPNTQVDSDGLVYKCRPKNVIKRKEYTKGQQFIVINTGGDIDKPYIIGVV